MRPGEDRCNPRTDLGWKMLGPLKIAEPADLSSVIDHGRTRPSWGRVLLAVGILLIADMFLALVIGVMQLDHARHLLEDSVSSLGNDDLSGAIRGLDASTSALRLSSSLLAHPGVDAANLVPGLADDVAALRALAEVAGRGVDAAREVTDALTDAGGAELGVIGAIYQTGAFDLATMTELETAGRNVIDHLDAAGDTLESSYSTSLLPPVERAIQHAIERVMRSQDVARLAVDAAALLQNIVGADTPRRYLLALQAPSEARGGGGVIGVYGILTANGGRLNLEEVAPIEELGPVVDEPVEAPPAFVRLYGPLSALDDWRQANLSPIFPLTSRVLVRLFEQVRGQTLDGVIAMDPIALGQLSRGVPELSADGWNRTITNKSARRLLGFDIYRHFVHRERSQNVYLRGLIDELWRRIGKGEFDPRGMARGVTEAVSKQHLKMFSVLPEEQRLLEELGVTADPRSVSGPLQAIFHNNNSGNKLDFFLRRTQTTNILLQGDGSAQVTTTIELVNDLPRRGVRAMSRSGVVSGLDRGENRMTLHILLPREARLESFQIDGRVVDPYRGRDGGFPVIWRSLVIGPDEEAVVSVIYRLARAVSEADGVFRFTLWPHATIRPDGFTLTVVSPSGRSFRTASGVLVPVIERSGRLKEPETLVVYLSGTPPDS